MGAFALLGDIKLGLDIFQNSYHPDAAYQVQRLTELQSKISPEFHDTFFNSSSGVYLSGLQTEQALPLYLGVVPSSVRDSVLSKLVEDIQMTQKNHTTSGIIGIKYLMEVLSLYDRGDVALDLALQTTYPSWGYMIHSKYEPATTVWELWESDTAGPSMNSRNHHMFGSVLGWFYKHVAGITPLDPGYSRVRIQPNLLRHDNFTIKFATPRGDIHLNYTKQEYPRQEHSNSESSTIEFAYNITLPPCTSGTFHIPIAMDDREVTHSNSEFVTNIDVEESGVPIWRDWEFLSGVEGIQNVERIGNYLRVGFSNGRFRFLVTSSKVKEMPELMQS